MRIGRAAPVRKGARSSASPAKRLVQEPKGPRVADAIRIPTRAYHRDHLSSSYRHASAAHAHTAMSAA